jgi:hypothetical protein
MDAKKETARSARHAGDEAAGTTKEATERTGAAVRDFAEASREKAERFTDQQSETVEHGVRAAAEVGERLAAGTAAGADALARSGSAIAKGWQDAGRIWVELAQDAVKESVEATESFWRCRNLGDILQAQSAYLRHSLDLFLDKSTQISDLSARMIAEATQNLAARGGEPQSEASRAARR